MTEPTRLLESASDPALREALRVASHEAPTRAQLEQLADHVASASVGTSALGATWLKLTLGVLAVGGTIFVARPAPTPGRVSTVSPPTTWHAPPVVPEVAPVVTVSPMVEPARELNAPASVEVPKARAKRRTRDVIVRALPAPPVSEVVAAPVPAAPPPSELALLQQAQRVLRSAPRRALSLVAEHRALYPNGEFAEEREVTALDALASLRDGSLQTKARDFLRRYPSSFHGEHVRRLLER